LVSPYAKRGHVDSTELDFTSELKFIENNWNVDPLAQRDAAANDITSAFDFKSPPREARLLGTTRAPDTPPNTRTGAVYACYGAVLLLPGLIAVADRRRRDRRMRAST
jgi:phospholipase C